jgi:hypothetical protein
VTVTRFVLGGTRGSGARQWRSGETSYVEFGLPRQFQSLIDAGSFACKGVAEVVQHILD